MEIITNDRRNSEDYKHSKNTNNDILVFVDNCYGEFTQDKEPVEVGADLIAGSLIKILGRNCSYRRLYCWRRLYVEKSAYRLTAPGLARI